MSIYLVTGPPGAGKSLFCVRKAMDALEKGLWVATNVEFHEGWEHELVDANVFRKPFAKRREKLARQFKERTYVTHDLGALTRLRLPPCKRCPSCKRGLRCMKEGRGVMILDESHNWLNARTWDSDPGGASRPVSRVEATQNRLKIVRFFSQHRKLGWTVYLVSQDAAQIDAQVRRNFEYHVHLRNFRNFKVIGIRVFPMHLFTAVTTWYDSEQSKVGASVYTLNRKIARLYDTTATSHGLDWDDPDAIWLGDHGDRPSREGSESAAAIRRATPDDVRAVISRLAGGAVALELRCPHCSGTFACQNEGRVSGVDAGPAEGPVPNSIYLRCPHCHQGARLGVPKPEVLLPAGVG